MRELRPDEARVYEYLERIQPEAVNGPDPIGILIQNHRAAADRLDALEAALKGARDTLERIPEGVRGNHDAAINRALRRADKVLDAALPTAEDVRGLFAEKTP